MHTTGPRTHCRAVCLCQLVQQRELSMCSVCRASISCPCCFAEPSQLCSQLCSGATRQPALLVPSQCASCSECKRHLVTRQIQPDDFVPHMGVPTLETRPACLRWVQDNSSYLIDGVFFGYGWRSAGFRWASSKNACSWLDTRS